MDTKYGRVFKEMQKMSKTTFVDLKEVIGRDALTKFENGISMLSFDRLNGAIKIMGFTMNDFCCLTGEVIVPRMIGKTFHDFRFQRGYRTDFFKELGVSPLRVELFEAGKIMLPYDVLHAMLYSIHVPESDFSTALNDGHDDYFIRIIDDLDRYYLDRDIKKIREIEHEASKYSKNIEPKKTIPDNDENHDYSMDRLTRQFTDYRVLELTAKGAHTPLSDDEIVEIGDFLFGVKLWTEYGLGILALDAHYLSYHLLHDILSEIRKKIWRYKEKLVYRRRIVEAAGRCALKLIQSGQFEQAEELLRLVEEFDIGLDVQVQGMYRFTEAYLGYAKSSDIQERECFKRDMLKTVDYFDFIHESHMKVYCQRICNEILDE